MIKGACGTIKGSIKLSEGRRQCLACRDIHSSAEEMLETRCPSYHDPEKKAKSVAIPDKAVPLWF